VNNSTLYQSASNAFMRAVYITLMGDPTLRQDPICPPSGLLASSGTNGVTLNWNAGCDPVLGYNVYRSTDPAGLFARLNSSLILATNYTDVEFTPGTYYYMVRGVRLETNPSGSYYNASEGVFTNVNVTAQPASISLGITFQPGGFGLSWNSLPGTTYQVLASGTLSTANWTNVSGTIMATGFTATWSGSAGMSNSQCFYEIASP
jgi:hypothetical protein